MTDESTPLPTIDSRRRFAEAIGWAFTRAMREGGRSRRILCVDRDFADWPLDGPELLDGLTAWLRAGQRQLILLAASYEELPRRHSRFVAWRRNFTHAVFPYVAPEDVAAALPTLLLDDDGTCVRLIDAVHWRGRAYADEREARPWREQIDALVQRSEPGFPAQTLGL